jgi:hypothetical protein
MTYAESFVQQWARSIAERVILTQGPPPGGAVLTFGNKAETVNLSTALEYEEAMRVLADAVERIMGYRQNDR